METQVAAIIEGEDGSILMVRQGQARWCFPSGPRVPAESHEAAIRRVVHALLGVSLEIHTGQPPVTGEHAGRKALYRFFLGCISGGELKPTGGLEAAWMSGESTRHLELDPLTRQVANWYLDSAE
jgi:hypothetical protein